MFAVIYIARRYHFVADQPLWLILGALILTQFVTTAVAVAFPPGTPNARPRLLLTSAWKPSYNLVCPPASSPRF